MRTQAIFKRTTPRHERLATLRLTAALSPDTGHGPFLMRSVNKTITIGDMEVSEGDIIFADTDGVCKVPATHAEEVVAVAGEIRRW